MSKKKTKLGSVVALIDWFENQFKTSVTFRAAIVGGIIAVIGGIIAGVLPPIIDRIFPRVAEFVFVPAVTTVPDLNTPAPTNTPSSPIVTEASPVPEHGLPTPTVPPTSPTPTEVIQGHEGSFLDRAYAGEFRGSVVTVFGNFYPHDEDNFNKSKVDFNRTGIDIQYERSPENSNFRSVVSGKVDSGNPPDIIAFGEPDFLRDEFAKYGHIVDVRLFLDEDKLKTNYDQSWLDMAMMEGPDGPIMAGVWYRFNTKSLVWYPKDDFEARGYEIPQTWTDLIALSDQIVEDGSTPWCIGNEAGDGSGWPATDWIEEIMLRTTSLENYDKWVSGELPFSSREVKRAAEIMSTIWFNDDYVYGGRSSITTTSFDSAPNPMFENPPKCWLHKQGNFITWYFPEDVRANEDYDFFYLPPIDPTYGRPFLISGDIMAMFNDRPEVRAVMEYFSTGESVKGWLAAGGATAASGAISPHNDAKLEWYGNDIERRIAEMTQEATSFRFDGSDLMPGEVGTGSFWSGMIDYVNGEDIDSVLNEIDASWPR